MRTLSYFHEHRNQTEDLEESLLLTLFMPIMILWSFFKCPLFQAKNRCVFVLHIILDFSAQAGELERHPLRTGTKAV